MYVRSGHIANLSRKQDTKPKCNTTEQMLKFSLTSSSLHSVSFWTIIFHEIKSKILTKLIQFCCHRRFSPVTLQDYLSKYPKMLSKQLMIFFLWIWNVQIETLWRRRELMAQTYFSLAAPKSLQKRDNGHLYRWASIGARRATVAAVVSENTIIIIIDNTKIEMLAQSSCWAAQMSSLSR